MAKNEFLPFGTGASANVLSNEEYAALTARIAGFSAGVAKSKELNKVWRQSSVIANVVAQFIVDNTGNDVLDNSDTQTLKANLIAALNTQAAGRLLSTKTFASSAMYTPTAGTKRVYVRIWGAGGSGANTNVVNTGVASGAGGGYSEGWIDVPAVPTAVTVGVGGTSVAANTLANGTAGGASSFMIMTCNGGPGGTITSAVIPGGTAVGGSVMNIRGQGVQGSISAGLGGVGGASFSSYGGLPHTSVAGDDGGFPGGGGAGGSNVTASGRGANGYVIIEEYS
ncbi:glycine-rich domain-containing protein [Serratia fonticola]|uniref:glycine-rich domain-containing protein n=1 Tax=Serratia fonticola TaxID=47917 RepID=UPI00217A79CE|nr:hypothetical protein [Serratia fonticola]CAI1595134.1 Uncharacterised protein [Serratia fonticola]CAI1904040.1 Uncharacterised protein [Serratia fonticola]CAI1927990.1 Uncharacterised protein [Serratia fonticola]